MQKGANDKMMNKMLVGFGYKTALYHGLVWMTFITYELGTLFAMVGLKTHYWHYAIYYFLYIGLFYFNAHVLLDFSFFRTNRPYLTATALVILEMLSFGLLKAVIDGAFSGGQFLLPLLTKAYLLSNIFRQVFFIGFSTAYWSLLSLIRFRNQAHQMEVEQLKHQARTLELENRYISVENAYLQNQISPHLLFNALNFIYYAVYRLSERAGKGIMLLSDLLRYSLTSGETQQKGVPLELEVAQIQKLIELDHMRFRENRYLSFKKKGDLSGYVILPLSLMTLVENMIKHGECSDPAAPATAELTLLANKLHFTTVNRKRETTPYPVTGLGLHNLKKRLSNAYQDRFELTITDLADRFSVQLIIEL